jgi:hypothetical protein
LEGFRLTRENPRAFVRWAIFSFVVSVLGAFVSVMMPARMRDAAATLAAKETPDLQTFFDALVALSPLLIFGLAVQAMMAAAIYRIIFRHDDDRFGYLRLGADELRLMALSVIYVVLAVLATALLAFAAILLAALSAMISPALSWFVGASAYLFSLGLLLFFAVRLSLAPVATFAERRLAIFESWGLTHGQFWRLLGAYILALACIVVVGFLTLFLFVAIAGLVLLASGGQMSDISGVFKPDETSIRAYLTPAVIAYMAVGSLVTALYYAVIAAPGAVAYRQLHGDPPSMSGQGKSK